jgi:hypothetical protein
MQIKNLKPSLSSFLKLDIFCLAVALESTLALAVMLAIPGDPKNAWLLGYSSTRVAIMAFLLGVGLAFGLAALSFQRGAPRTEAMRQALRSVLRRPSLVLVIILSALTAALLVLFAILAVLNIHDVELRLRLLPLLVWGLLICLQTLAASMAWYGHLNRQRLVSAGADILLDLGQVHLALLFVLALLVIAMIGVVLLSYQIPAASLARYLPPQAVNDYIIKFNAGFENNIPTFFNAVLLLVCAALLAWLAAGYARKKLPFAARWGVLSVVFLLLAMDEIADLHRYCILPVRRTLHLTGMWRNAWFVAMLPLLVLLAWWCWPLIKSLPARMQRNIWLAAGLYAGGAMAVNVIGLALVQAAGSQNFATELLKVLEEALEMGGILLFSYTLAEILAGKISVTRFSVLPRNAVAAPDEKTAVRLAFWKPAAVLAGITLALFLINLAVELHTLYPPAHDLLSKSTWSLLSNIFDMDMETAFPNFFSTFMLISVTAVSAWAAALDKENKGGWLGIAVVFFILALDETASLHNSLVYVYRVDAVSSEMQNYFWFVPLIPVLALLGLAYLRFWLRLPAFQKIFFVLSAVVYIGGAAGIEVISGWLAVLEGANSRYYNLTMLMEETSEMIGVILFLHCLFHYLAGRKPEFTVNVVRDIQQVAAR